MSDWQRTLGATPDCIDVLRYAEELTTAERAHLEKCVHCQTELKLFREVMAEESSPESRWIAEKLQKRDNVVPFRPKAWPALYAAAAVLVLLIGNGTWLRSHGPSVEIPTGTDIYRSARLELVTPIGDVQRAPNELRWKSVTNATRYRVRVAEVDGTVVWSGETGESHIALPPDIAAQFKPGKTLRWDVQAFRANALLAASETQTVRVIP